MGSTIEMKGKVFKGLSLIDETFDVKHLPNYQLFIQLGHDGLVCCVLDTLRNKFIAFENYTFQSVATTNALSENIKQLTKEDYLVSKCVRAKKIELLWVNKRSTIIPNALYDNDSKKQFLDFNHPLEKDDLVTIDHFKKCIESQKKQQN